MGRWLPGLVDKKMDWVNGQMDDRRIFFFSSVPLWRVIVSRRMRLQKGQFGQ